jgi:predicted nucleotidyltransferase
MNFDEFLREYGSIERRFQFSREKLGCLRDDIAKAVADSSYRDKITLVTMGSYGRKEASESSDIDCYVLFDSDKPGDAIKNELNQVQGVIRQHIAQEPGDTGTFGTSQPLLFSNLLNNISSDEECTKDMTRRMLLLLEGDWLYGKDRFETYRKELLKKYIGDHRKDNAIPRFLLNDIIRYYRTITTDFEYKTTAQKKSWGLRSAKLRFSRQLLYFGGVIAVAEIADVEVSERIDRMLEILALPVLQRIYELNPSGSGTADIFTQYNIFLDIVSDIIKRQELAELEKMDRYKSKTYVEIKEKSQAFTQALADWLKAKYPIGHPIHQALIF